MTAALTASDLVSVYFCTDARGFPRAYAIRSGHAQQIPLRDAERWLRSGKAREIGEPGRVHEPI